MWIRTTVRARVTKANDSAAVWARPHGAVWTWPVPTSIAQTTDRTGHLRVLTSQKRNDDDEAEAHEAEEEREIDRWRAFRCKHPSSVHDAGEGQS